MQIYGGLFRKQDCKYWRLISQLPFFLSGDNKSNHEALWEIFPQITFSLFTETKTLTWRSYNESQGFCLFLMSLFLCWCRKNRHIRTLKARLKRLDNWFSMRRWFAGALRFVFVDDACVLASACGECRRSRTFREHCVSPLLRYFTGAQQKVNKPGLCTPSPVIAYCRQISNGKLIIMQRSHTWLPTWSTRSILIDKR